MRAKGRGDRFCLYAELGPDLRGRRKKDGHNRAKQHDCPRPLGRQRITSLHFKHIHTPALLTVSRGSSGRAMLFVLQATGIDQYSFSALTPACATLPSRARDRAAQHRAHEHDPQARYRRKLRRASSWPVGEMIKAGRRSEDPRSEIRGWTWPWRDENRDERVVKCAWRRGGVIRHYPVTERNHCSAGDRDNKLVVTPSNCLPTRAPLDYSNAKFISSSAYR